MMTNEEVDEAWHTILVVGDSVEACDDAWARLEADHRLVRAELAKLRIESDNKLRGLVSAIVGMQHRVMADGRPCWCLLWPDEDPEATLHKDSHGSHCDAAYAAVTAAKVA